MKRSTTLTAVAVCATAVMGMAALAATPASADPTPATPYRPLALQGSDTTQDVMNGFAAAITAPASGNVYRATALLHDAVTAGGSVTSITTSLLPAVSDSITIDPGTANAEIVTVVSIDTTASANTAVSPATNAVNFNTLTVTPGLTKAHGVNAVVSGALVAAGTKILASYNAVGAAFQSKANPNCQYIANNTGATSSSYSGTTQNGAVGSGANSVFLSGGRANGSGTGANSMNDSWSTSSALWGCTDVARASSKRSNLSNIGAGNAVNIPFAIDAVDFAVTTSSNFTRKQSWDDLKAIYRCDAAHGMIPANQNLGGQTVYQFAATSGQLYAQLPQSGSGTRSFIVGALGLTESATAAAGNTGAACITDKTPSGAPLEEHDLRFLDDNGIGLTSIAQSIAQRNQVVVTDDKQGRTTLVAVDNTAAGNGGTAHGNGKISYAVNMATQFTGGTGNGAGNLQLWRDVFNVVPSQRLNDPTIAAVFVGSGSAICTDATGVLGQYGFAANPNCGVTTNVG